MSQSPKSAVLVAGIGLMFAAGCDEPNAMPDGGVYGTPNGPAVAAISGFVWDPEAFWFSIGTCVPHGETCPIPPIRVDGVPIFERSVVNGSMVLLLDPAVGMPTLMAQAPSNMNGGFNIYDVISRPGPPFFLLALPPDASTTPLMNAGPPTLPPVPPAHYLPTLTLQAIFTGNSTICLAEPASLMGDAGILQALAKYLTIKGTATTVPDFIDPTKFGGVAVWWLFLPADPPVRVPAFGTKMDASMGTSYQIDWAPPGVLPPPIAALQSDRGFFVNDQAPVSPFGITVTVLPAAPPGPPPEVVFTPVDPSNDATTGHPYIFPHLPPIPIAPGAISFGELPAIQPGNTAGPPDWTCLQ